MSQVEELNPVIEHYREHHHAVASMVAAGMTPAMIRRKTGISTHRLTLYMADPTFNELVVQKAKIIEEKFEENIDTYLDLGVSNMILAETMVSEHLHQAIDREELLPIGTLDRISQGRADRFGYSKHTVLHHNHDFASALDRAIARSGKAEPKQIEAQAAPAVLNQPALPAPPERVGAPPLSPARSLSSVLSPIKRRRVA